MRTVALDCTCVVAAANAHPRGAGAITGGCGSVSGLAPPVNVGSPQMGLRLSGSAQQADRRIATRSTVQCGLGDAFRCAGCPYRGLPSFEMGKKIELVSDPSS